MLRSEFLSEQQRAFDNGRRNPGNMTNMLENRIPAVVTLPVLMLGVLCLPSWTASAQLLSQPPGACEGEPFEAYYSTSTTGTGGMSVVAEDFSVFADGTEVGSVKVWGTYFQASASVDDFTVRVHERLGSGLPGTVLATPSVSSTRRLIGTFGSAPLDQYEYRLSFDPPLVLAQNPYFIEIFNDAEGWSWQCGDLDPIRGIQGLAGSGQAPGVFWSRYSESADLSMELFAGFFSDGFESGDTSGWSSSVP